MPKMNRYKLAVKGNDTKNIKGHVMDTKTPTPGRKIPADGGGL